MLYPPYSFVHSDCDALYLPIVPYICDDLYSVVFAFQFRHLASELLVNDYVAYSSSPVYIVHFG